MKKLSISDVKKLEVNDISEMPKDEEVSFTSFQAFNLFLFRKVLKKLKQNKEEIAKMKIVDEDRMVLVNNKIGLMPMMITM